MTRRTDGASRSIPCRHTLTHLVPPRRRLRLKGTLHESFDPAEASSAYAGRASSRSARAAQDASDSGSDEDSSDDGDEMKCGEGGGGRNAAQEESDEGDETDESGDDDDAEEEEEEQEQETDGEHAPRLLSAGPGARRRAGSTPPEPDDATKGTHIGTQKRLWDSLLQLRMRLQPAMEAARQLPRADAQAALRSGGGVGQKKRQRLTAGLDAAAAELSGLLGDLGDLQRALVATNLEFSAAVAKRRRLQPPGQEEEEEGQEEQGQEDDENALLAWGRLQVILPPAPGTSNEGGSSELLVPLPAVSWPWVPAWGLLEPPR